MKHSFNLNQIDILMLHSLHSVAKTMQINLNQIDILMLHSLHSVAKTMQINLN